MEMAELLSRAHEVLIVRPRPAARPRSSASSLSSRPSSGLCGSFSEADESSAFYGSFSTSSPASPRGGSTNVIAAANGASNGSAPGGGGGGGGGKGLKNFIGKLRRNKTMNSPPPLAVPSGGADEEGNETCGGGRASRTTAVTSSVSVGAMDINGSDYVMKSRGDVTDEASAIGQLDSVLNEFGGGAASAPGTPGASTVRLRQSAGGGGGGRRGSGRQLEKYATVHEFRNAPPPGLIAPVPQHPNMTHSPLPPPPPPPEHPPGEATTPVWTAMTPQQLAQQQQQHLFMLHQQQQQHQQHLQQQYEAAMAAGATFGRHGARQIKVRKSQWKIP